MLISKQIRNPNAAAVGAGGEGGGPKTPGTSVSLAELGHPGLTGQACREAQLRLGFGWRRSRAQASVLLRIDAFGLSILIATD